MNPNDRAKNGATTMTLARIFLALIFLSGGLSKLSHFAQTQAYMAAHGMFATRFFLVAAIIVELGGAVSLITGYYARRGALVLALYLIPVTLVFHQFWMVTGMDAQMQLVNFLKNVAIIGGLMHVVRVGALGYSLDHRLHTRDERPLGRWREIHVTGPS